MRKIGLLAAFAGALIATKPASAAPDAGAVVETYADIAFAAYDDSLSAARTLRQAVLELVTSPSERSMRQAREAWLAARVPYMQTEVYRFATRSSTSGKAR